jgi:hypothetical protein
MGKVACVMGPAPRGASHVPFALERGQRLERGTSENSIVDRLVVRVAAAAAWSRKPARVDDSAHRPHRFLRKASASEPILRHRAYRAPSFSLKGLLRVRMKKKCHHPAQDARSGCLPGKWCLKHSLTRTVMLIKAQTLKGYTLHSRDGEIGKVKEFYFDDRYWTVRYLVADTGNWLTGREVLISPYALAAVKHDERYINVDLTRQQIEDSPSPDTDKPVSRQFEENYYGYYGWPMYWGGAYMWGAYPDIARDRELWKESSQDDETWDSRLRSTHDVSGHYIQATDGEIGHVDDFIIDDETWAIRYKQLVARTKGAGGAAMDRAC